MSGIGFAELFLIALILAVLVGLLLLVVFIILRIIRPTGTAAARETPLDTLRRRLAAGEITPEEYDELRRRLEE